MVKVGDVISVASVRQVVDRIVLRKEDVRKGSEKGPEPGG